MNNLSSNPKYRSNIRIVTPDGSVIDHSPSVFRRHENSKLGGLGEQGRRAAVSRVMQLLGRKNK